MLATPSPEISLSRSIRERGDPDPYEPIDVPSDPKAIKVTLVTNNNNALVIQKRTRLFVCYPKIMQQPGPGAGSVNKQIVWIQIPVNCFNSRRPFAAPSSQS